MRSLYAFVFALSLAGCSITPPKPPSCSGDFRPANKLEQHGVVLGDIEKAGLCQGARHELG